MNNNTFKERREFLKKSGKIAVASPTVIFLMSASNPQVALGYGDTCQPQNRRTFSSTQHSSTSYNRSGNWR